LQQPTLDIRAQFRVLPGRVCALVGRSGSGKSALLKATAGIDAAVGGRISLGTDALYDSSTGLDLPAHQRKLPWLDAQCHLFPHLTVRQNLAFGLGGAKMPAEDSAFDRVVKWLGLDAVLHQQPASLGMAQRVRVALGRAVLSRPCGLLIDDLLGKVPDAEREPLLDLLAELPARFKVPVVLVSPRMNEVIRMADEVVILHEGRMASAGATAQVLSDVSLSTFLEGQHAGSVLEGTVKRHDIDWLLSEVAISGQRLTVPATTHPVGSKVRLKVRARDITLHRNVPTDTSSANHLRGRITQIMLAGEHGTYGAVGIELDHAIDSSNLQVVPGATLWAMLTRKSIQQMDWAPGQPCVLGFKAMAAQVTAWR
jgi:molybdate transport system ATP-binding protein